MKKEEVKFSEEQIEYVKEILQEEMANLIKEMEQNYIPRTVIEGMLKILKEQKLKCDTKFRELYVDGGIWIIQEVLNYKFERIEE